MAHHPATTGRTRFDIADIVRQHRAALETETDLTTAQRRVLSAIELCRTVALGGHIETCRSCSFEQPAYNSCRNRHCPKCQALAQERWIAARSKRILPARHFHIIFTLPSGLRALARFRPSELFRVLFHAASETLLELGRSRLGAELGITMVLHTWTRDLRFHPHVHSIVTAGGLSLDAERWVDSRRRYLFPIQIMGELLRGKVLAALRGLHCRRVFDDFDDFRDPEAFERLMVTLARQSWIVYAKKPFRRADHVLQYLGRYTHRVGIANSRLTDVTDDGITFRTKNGRTATLAPVEFLRRFVKHVLPARFVKIRHYGLLAASHVDGKLESARRLLLERGHTPPASNTPTASSWPVLLLTLTGRDARLCPVCAAPLTRIPLPYSARAPPPSLAA